MSLQLPVRADGAFDLLRVTMHGSRESHLVLNEDKVLGGLQVSLCGSLGRWEAYDRQRHGRRPVCPPCDQVLCTAKPVEPLAFEVSKTDIVKRVAAQFDLPAKDLRAEYLPIMSVNRPVLMDGQIRMRATFPEAKLINSRKTCTCPSPFTEDSYLCPGCEQEYTDALAASDPPLTQEQEEALEHRKG